MKRPVMVFYPKGYKLNEKQRLFCDKYLENGFNSYQAAIDAGYSKRIAKQAEQSLLTRPHVHLYIKQNVGHALSKVNQTSKGILDRNMSKLNRVVDATIPDSGMLDVDAITVGLKAIDIQAKIHGHYAPTKTANLNVNIDKDQISEAKALLNKLVDTNTKDY